MEEVTGVTAKKATFEDFQRLYKCQNKQTADCNQKGLQFPTKCSFPPCNQCVVKIHNGEFDRYYKKVLQKLNPYI